MAIEALCNQVILTCAFLSDRLKLARKVNNSIEAYESQRGNLMEVSHGAQDGRVPPQVASEKLKEVKKNDRDIRLQCHRFYSHIPTIDAQTIAVAKLSPLMPVHEDWHFQDVLTAANSVAPNFTHLLFLSRRPPILDKLEPWKTTWEEDKDLRDILETFQDQSQTNAKSALRSGIIKNDILRLNGQYIEDCAKFAENSLHISAVEVSIDTLGRIEKEFRSNLVDVSSTFDKMNFLNEDGTTTEIVVLNWIEETKINLKQIKSKMEAKDKIKADTIKFERENKLRALPKLQITPFNAPQDWLSWVSSITSIARTYSKDEIASPQFISLIKSSINIEEDRSYTKNLDDVHLIISYLKGKYLTCGLMLDVTLKLIEDGRT